MVQSPSIKAKEAPNRSARAQRMLCPSRSGLPPRQDADRVRRAHGTAGQAVFATGLRRFHRPESPADGRPSLPGPSVSAVLAGHRQISQAISTDPFARANLADRSGRRFSLGFDSSQNCGLPTSPGRGLGLWPGPRSSLGVRDRSTRSSKRSAIRATGNPTLTVLRHASGPSGTAGQAKIVPALALQRPLAGP